jgi:succinate dehydrogenase / fumarate reductase iron-sulfur subunit
LDNLLYSFSGAAMNLTLRIWRQRNATTPGQFVTYEAREISPDTSFLEMLDLVNEELIKRGEEPIAFDHDCREGICGSCGLVINGVPHGPLPATTTCQVHMRVFKDGDTITIEPWRAAPFPVIKDLVVDRSAFDRIIEAGGYVSVSTGGAPDGNAILVPKENADRAFDAAACISCGACVAACKNASAMLFTSAKVSHLSLLPQGKVEEDRRVLNMVAQMDEEGFGNCTNIGSCEAACPKVITLDNIARMNRLYLKASLKNRLE